MPFDGLFIHSLLKTLTTNLKKARLSKIYQPFDNDLILIFRNQGINYKLLIPINAQHPRMHITTKNIINPDTASTFVMVLRKYLEGAILNEIKQVGMERIINLYFSNRNEFGDETNFVLSVELMGRHSNVILYNKATNKIIDLLKRINPEDNRVRLLLPHADYQLPPLITGIDGSTITQSEFGRLLAKYTTPLDMVNKFNGLDSDDKKELLGYFNNDFSFDALKLFMSNFDKPQGYVLQTVNHQNKFFCYRPRYLNLYVVLQSEDINKALDDFYQDMANKEWVRQKAKEVENVVNNENKKLSRKLIKLQKQLDSAENSTEFRIKGEILNVYLSSVKPGITTISLPNYYDENKPINIKLDPALSPAKNAQKYFVKYQKLRNSIKFIKEQIKLTQDNLAYFDTIQTAINNAEPQDIALIREELINQGYIRQHNKNNNLRKKKITADNIACFTLTSGKKVWVGKNNYQNDWLTLKKADKRFLWLHVKNIPGSHVILQDIEPTMADIKEAAEIAAYFSKARYSANVVVDYITVKKIKKPKGAKPGFVIYTGQQSISVTPIKEDILCKRDN